MGSPSPMVGGSCFGGLSPGTRPIVAETGDEYVAWQATFSVAEIGDRFSAGCGQTAHGYGGARDG